MLSPRPVFRCFFDGIELLKKVELGGMKQRLPLREEDYTKAVLLRPYADPSDPIVLTRLPMRRGTREALYRDALWFLVARRNSADERLHEPFGDIIILMGGRTHPFGGCTPGSGMREFVELRWHS